MKQSHQRPLSDKSELAGKAEAYLTHALNAASEESQRALTELLPSADESQGEADVIRNLLTHFPSTGLDDALFRNHSKEYTCISPEDAVPFETIDIVRVIASVSSNSFWERIGADVAGPLITFYVDWLVDTLLAQGISTVVVDCTKSKLLLHLINRSVAYRQCPLDVVELETDFKFTFLASIDRLTADDILHRVNAKTIGDLFDLFGIPQNSNALANVVNKSTGNAEIMASITRFLMGENLRHHIETQSRQNRDLLLAHLIPLFGGKNSVAFAAIDNSSQAQAHLEKMLSMNDLAGRLSGFYLFNNSAAATRQRNDVREICYLNGDQERFGDFDGLFSDAVAHNFRVLQTICHSAENEHLDEIGTGGLRFQAWWHAVGHSQISLGDAAPAATPHRFFQRACRAIAYRLLMSPTLDEASQIGALQFNPWHVGYEAVRLIAPGARVDILNRGFSGACKQNNLFWPAGALASLHEDLVRPLWRCPTGNVDLESVLSDTAVVNKKLEIKTIPSACILDHKVTIGGWCTYRFHVNCPHCQASLNCELAGTLLVEKYVQCANCNHLLTLGYREIKSYLDRNHHNALSETFVASNATSGRIAAEVNHSAQKDVSVPLLVSLSNEYFMGQLYNMALKLRTPTAEKNEGAEL